MSNSDADNFALQDVDMYNGWKNKATWNVSLWINNTEPLYHEAVDFMKHNKKHKSPYKAFVKYCLAMAYIKPSTPDGYLWQGHYLDYKALNRMMRELV